LNPVERRGFFLLKEILGNADNLVMDRQIPRGSGGKPIKGYKKQRALELWAEYAELDPSRKDLIDLFVGEIEGMTRGVATTYAHLIATGKWQ
jgi:hypothetical protein